MPYFGEPVGRVKIQTTSKNSQRYYTTKRLIRDLLSNTPNCYVRGGELRKNFIYGGMRDRSMRSGTKLAREIQLTDWSTAGNLSNRSSGVQIPRDIKKKNKKNKTRNDCFFFCFELKKVSWLTQGRKKSFLVFCFISGFNFFLFMFFIFPFYFH